MRTFAPSRSKSDEAIAASTPQTGAARAILLIVGSTAFALVLAEMGLRIYHHFAPHVSGTLEIVPANATSDLRYVMPFVSRLPVVQGTEREWFTMTPASPPNRTRASAQSF